MKLIQSFWTMPTEQKKQTSNWTRENGGWVSRKYHYYSWALSCHTLLKHHGYLELYTDTYGYELLIEQMKLPYSAIKVTLDNLPYYHSDLWALGKLEVYKSQEEPFIHVDGDVFIWEKFNSKILSSSLVVQNLEDDFTYYGEIYNDITKNFSYIPAELKKHYDKTKTIAGINAGILGGIDIDFIHYYVDFALSFLTKNSQHISSVNVGLLNNFYEQSLFRILADLSEINITPLLRKVNETYDGLCELTSVRSCQKFAHAVGNYKRRAETGDLIAYHLKTEFPETYSRINSLLRNHLI